ncbi:MAG: phospholipid carrier-dependent glycosyltransferase, partial [Patescibacteria group bacterium]
MHIKVLQQRYRKTALLVLVGTAIIIGLCVRTQNLGALHPFENDEQSWLLMGTSLLQQGIPVSWTVFWDKYPTTEIFRYGGLEQLVVTPFLDHPPLFGLFIGAWAALTGNNTYRPLDWMALRMPMIALAMGTILFTGLFINKLFHSTLASVTAIVFLFFPAHIVASRFIAAEHAIAFLFMLSLYVFAVFDSENNKNTPKAALCITIIALCSGMAILLKLSGIVLPATIIFLSLFRKNWLLLGVTLLATSISISLFLLYGNYYDWGIFTSVLSGHSTRPQSFWHFWSIFTQMDIGNFTMRDPSFIAGMIGLFTLLTNTNIAWEKRLTLFVPLLNLSLVFLFVAPVESYGWYKFIWFP